MEQDQLPLGMGMALAMDVSAMERFAELTETEKRGLIAGARAVQSREKMRAYLHEHLSDRQR